MSLRELADTINSLPYALSDQVLSYAKSLELSAPDIFKDAGIERTKELTDTLVFIAGLRKLFSIVNSNYWVIDNAGAILSKQNQYEVRVGRTDLSRGGTYHQALNALSKDLYEILSQHNLLQYVQNMPYSEIVRKIANGH
ncbi:MAG: hypothetical protein WC649_10285 [Desulfobacteria bacterium]|jgi:hypothetical protein